MSKENNETQKVPDMVESDLSKSEKKKLKSERKDKKRYKKEKRERKEKSKEKKERKDKKRKRDTPDSPPPQVGSPDHVLDSTTLHEEQPSLKKSKVSSSNVSTFDRNMSFEGDVEDVDIGLGEQVKAKVETNDIGSFGISDTTQRLLKEKDITSLFDIQAATYKLLRLKRKDVIGRARTGSGKTLAFVIPIVETMAAENMTQVRSHEKPLVLCLAPTRELAQQVHRDFEWIGRGHHITTACFTGGTAKGPQKGQLRRGIDVLVGTPGRIMDHLNEETLSLAGVQFIVLDEADEMLSMGFQEDVERILGACTSTKMKQTLLFSATIPRWVSGLAQKYMRKDATVTVDTVSDEKNRTNKSITHLALQCPPFERANTIADIVKVHTGAFGKTIIFTDTKAEANELSAQEKLRSALGEIGVLHGDIPQGQRESTLSAYREGIIRVLVATDVAARGLDIKAVDLILQTHPPSNYETYIHRSGRTGRAGKTGTCVTCYSAKEKYLIGLIEHKAGIKFKRAKPPQASDIVKATISDTTRRMSSVHEDNVALFREVARKVLQSFEKEDDAAETALAASLACMAGYTTERVKSRSILSCFEGYRTVVVTSDRPFGHIGQMWGMMKRAVGQEESNLLKGGLLCKDKHMAVVDAPDALVAEIERIRGMMPNGCSIEVVDELPELDEEKFDLKAAMSRVYERNQMQRAKWNSGGRGGGRGRQGYQGSFGGGGGGGNRRGWGGGNRY
ncbi:Nucleolar RNA helicase 2 [Gracilariopsis chorda]|uniref:RNA helicase n=1 Tax=Gracilariopsis chorda TaxID=448386 RepID=A0A2V3IP85_9FLOR|nr:Nucleolar RNA helicase 2 [Gracilariopsis chorda]|eukprot:PXF43901.1 Nucleolar RNA helicase 2 [Gracilariopsis chorda]